MRKVKLALEILF